MSYRKDSIYEVDPYPDNVYYDLTIQNLRNNNIKDNLHLQFNETRQSPILHNSEEYYLSVIRFFVSSYSLPVLFFAIEPNQADINKGAYTVTLEYVYNTIDAEMVHVDYVPQDANADIPLAPNTTSNGYQQESSYYFCYNYEYVLRLFNIALKTAFNNLKARWPDVPAFKNGFPPSFKWDYSSNKPILSGMDSIYNIDNPSNPAMIKVYFNRESWNLFNGIACRYFSTKDEYNRNYQVLFSNDSNSYLSQTEFGLFRFLELPSENDPTSNWSPISSIIFTTNTLPIAPTQLSLPKIYDNGVQISLTTTGSNYQNIISDITTDEMSYRPALLYIPQSENRMIDLKNNQPLQQIDISVYYRTKLGNIYPFVIPAGGSASMKILFERKLKYRS